MLKDDWKWKMKHMSPVSLDCDICLCKEQLYALLFSRQAMSNSLRPHKLQHIRLLCLSPSPRACSNSCPLSWWCHLTILSSVISFSSCPQSFPVSWAFTSGAQAIGASAPVLLMIQGWFHLGLTGLISLLSKRLSRVFSSYQKLNLLIFGFHSICLM